MARLPYVDIGRPDLAPLVEEIARERGEVPHLYRIILHSPPFAQGWLKFLTAVRQNGELGGALRELIIMRIALLNGASYEADQHKPMALKEGLLPQQLEHLAEWRERDCFDEAQQIVLSLTDAMTREIEVPASLFEEASRLFSQRQLVELAVTIAAYNMVSRFLVAMQIHSEDRVE